MNVKFKSFTFTDSNKIKLPTYFIDKIISYKYRKNIL